MRLVFPNPKLSVSLVYVLSLALAPSTIQAQADESRPGYVEIARETIGHDTYIHYVRKDVKVRFDTISAQLGDLEKKLLQSRRAIGNWERQLPGYMNQLDEWIAMDQEARTDLKKAEIQFACDFMLAHAAAETEKNVELGKETLAKHWDDFQKSSFKDESLKRILRAEHLITPEVRKWESQKQMVDTMHKIYHTAEALSDASKREYLAALANLLKTQIHDPGLQLVVADFDFLTAVTYAQLKTRTASARVEQLSRLGTSRLLELKSLTALYRRQIDQRKLLKNEREAILRDAKKPETKSPSS
jgi:hypothetical protein